MAQPVRVVWCRVDGEGLRPLGVATSKRAPELPNVPTVAASGLPPSTPRRGGPSWRQPKPRPEVIKRMNEEINIALKNPEIAKKLGAQSTEIVGGSSDAARIFIDKQIDTCAKVVKDNGIKATLLKLIYLHTFTGHHASTWI